MRKTILIVSGVALVIVLLGLILFGTAFAQTITRAESKAPQGNQQAQGSCHGGEAGEDAMWAPLAKALGISESQLRADIEAGKSLKEIAKGRGLDDQKLSTALLSAMKDEMNQHVQDGHLSQTEADTMLKHMEQVGAGHMLDMIDGDMSDDMMSGSMMGGTGPGTMSPDMMDGAAPGTMSPGMMGGSAPEMMSPDTTDDEGSGCHDDGATKGTVL